MPLEKMFVETDSPFLTPVPHRGKRNEPAYVRLVAETVASVKIFHWKTLPGLPRENVQNLFKI